MRLSEYFAYSAVERKVAEIESETDSAKRLELASKLVAKFPKVIKLSGGTLTTYNKTKPRKSTKTPGTWGTRVQHSGGRGRTPCYHHIKLEFARRIANACGLTLVNGGYIGEMRGGKGDKTPTAHFNPRWLRIGQRIEMEHTDNPKVARDIAKDHLTEDPMYYKKLIRAGLADEIGEARVNHGITQRGGKRYPAMVRAWAASNGIPIGTAQRAWDSAKQDAEDDGAEATDRDYYQKVAHNFKDRFADLVDAKPRKGKRKLRESVSISLGLCEAVSAVHVAHTPAHRDAIIALYRAHGMRTVVAKHHAGFFVGAVMKSGGKNKR